MYNNTEFDRASTAKLYNCTPISTRNFSDMLGGVTLNRHAHGWLDTHLIKIESYSKTLFDYVIHYPLQ